MNNGKKLISLIVITRNRCAELSKTLTSLHKQDRDFELVVVDNASTDDTPEMVRKHWPEARLIELQSNQGVSAGRNRGIEAARGEILVFLDDDASFRDEDALARISERFAHEPHLGILATNSLLASTGRPEIGAIPRRDKRVLQTDYQATYFCGVGFALRKELIKKVGYFFEKFFYSCEELDLSWRAINSGYRIVWAQDIVVLHRHSPVARTHARWIYANARNRVWLASRHLPWRYIISYTVLWWGFLLVVSIKNLVVIDCIKGIVVCIVGLPGIFKKRRVLSNTALKVLRNYSGRLVY